MYCDMYVSSNVMQILTSVSSMGPFICQLIVLYKHCECLIENLLLTESKVIISFQISLYLSIKGYSRKSINCLWGGDQWTSLYYNSWININNYSLFLWPSAVTDLSHTGEVLQGILAWGPLELWWVQSMTVSPQAPRCMSDRNVFHYSVSWLNTFSLNVNLIVQNDLKYSANQMEVYLHRQSKLPKRFGNVLPLKKSYIYSASWSWAAELLKFLAECCDQRNNPFKQIEQSSTHIDSFSNGSVQVTGPTLPFSNAHVRCRQ